MDTLFSNKPERQRAAKEKERQEEMAEDQRNRSASGLASISARGPQAEQDVIEIFRKAGMKPPDFSKSRARVIQRHKPK